MDTKCIKYNLKDIQKFYLENKDKIENKYPNKWIIITENAKILVFSDSASASYWKINNPDIISIIRFLGRENTSIFL